MTIYKSPPPEPTWARLIQSTPSHPILLWAISMLYSHLCLDLQVICSGQVYWPEFCINFLSLMQASHHAVLLILVSVSASWIQVFPPAPCSCVSLYISSPRMRCQISHRCKRTCTSVFLCFLNLYVFGCLVCKIPPMLPALTHIYCCCNTGILYLIKIHFIVVLSSVLVLKTAVFPLSYLTF